MQIRITCPQDAARYLRQVLKPDVEEFWVMALNADLHLLGVECLFRGTVDACFFHPRDLFRFGCRYNASSLIMAHNHPSQNPLPSPEDKKITSSVMRAARILAIPVTDHIIITQNRVFSFAQQGLL